MGKRELVALLSLSSWRLLSVVWLFLTVPWVCLHFVIVVFPDHTHLLFLNAKMTPFYEKERRRAKGVKRSFNIAKRTFIFALI